MGKMTGGMKNLRQYQSDRSVRERHTGGRSKGKSKAMRLRDAALKAIDKDGDGGLAWFKNLAETDPRAMVSIITKVLPRDVHVSHEHVINLSGGLSNAFGEIAAEGRAQLESAAQPPPIDAEAERVDPEPAPPSAEAPPGPQYGDE